MQYGKLMRNSEFAKYFKAAIILSLLGIFVGAVFFGGGGALLVFVISGILLLLWWNSARRRYAAIQQLSDHLDAILNGKENLILNTYREGELSSLEGELTKLLRQLKWQNKELKKQKTQLADAMADISHQLRTPLTTMGLITSFLGESQLPEERRLELTADLNRLLRQMEQLVTTMLKLSRLDAGVVTFSKREESVKALISLASDSLLIPLELNGVEFVTKVDPECVFCGDLTWTAEALSNLLKNAMEHTPSGGTITVTAEQNVLYTQISVSDTGPGFAKEDLPHLFERFYKGKEEASSTGFGIGLSLAKSIVSQQDGTLEAKNLPQGGACFVMRLYPSDRDRKGDYSVT